VIFILYILTYTIIAHINAHTVCVNLRELHMQLCTACACKYT